MLFLELSFFSLYCKIKNLHLIYEHMKPCQKWNNRLNDNTCTNATITTDLNIPYIIPFAPSLSKYLILLSLKTSFKFFEKKNRLSNMKPIEDIVKNDIRQN